MERSEESLRWGLEHAARLLVPEVFESLVVDRSRVLISEIPEFDTDAEIQRCVIASTRAGLRGEITWVASSAQQVPPMPEEFLTLPREMGRRRIPVRCLLHWHRIAQRDNKAFIARLAADTEDDPAVREEIIHWIGTRIDTLMSVALEATLTAYMAQAELAVEDAFNRHTSTIHEILRDDTITATDAEQMLRYPMSGYHAAAVLWSEPRETADEQPMPNSGTATRRLEDIARQLRVTLTNTSVLTLATAETTVWIWIATRTPSAIATDQIATALAAAPGARAALGVCAPGIAGFRRSHREARIAREFAPLLPTAGHRDTIATPAACSTAEMGHSTDAAGHPRIAAYVLSGNLFRIDGVSPHVAHFPIPRIGILRGPRGTERASR
ncbi:hypothetical protein [Nocardia seriolae]|uniref:Uncharacterized protein n=1 Tax=Nocardia seriolae TaxID=37332 RepID=A0A0B8N391_9NOCA|nr:hypothetical protein [Nocardia seriolae]GEM24101.1 hypothetical protein NS2_23400 [Nocardia seriolae NBRC 15557]MTJ61486.1 hypothetical protein [Nocardia seriolae]MTK39457.1 hypothetical protein [Nocardia seriolae]MTL12105.1 hypothetical protein [Nocardia seriolae]OJF78802.1 hypothetical protein NS14008_05695 [Nocardia seriolae]